MMKVSWTDRVRNYYVLERADAERGLLANIQIRKVKYFGHDAPEQHSESHARGSNWRSKIKRKAKNNLYGQHHVVIRHEILPRSCKNGARLKAMENCAIQPTPHG